jgi:hypothetical protein
MPHAPMVAIKKNEAARYPYLSMWNPFFLTPQVVAW